MLKSAWPLHMNRLSDNQDLPDIKQCEDFSVLQQTYYDLDSVCSSETLKIEDLYHGLTDPEQEEPWSYIYRTDHSGSYHVNPKTNIQGHSFHKNYKVPSALSEVSKDCYQMRDSWIPPLNKHKYDNDLGNVDMKNYSKTKQRKCSNFQDFSCTNTPDFPCFDAEAYTKLLQARQNYLKQDNFMPDQIYTAAKATQPMTDGPSQRDSSFVSEYDDRMDYGMKTFCGGNSSFLNHLQKVNQMRHDLQNSDYFKSASLKSHITNGSSNSVSCLNGQTESNYCNQLKLNSAQNCFNPSASISSVSSPLASKKCFQTYNNEHPACPSYEYSGTRTHGGLGKTREERIFELLSEKRLKPFNGVSEDASSLYSPLDNTCKKVFSGKNQGKSYNVDEMTFEDIAISCKEFLDNALNCNNPRQGSGDYNPLNESKLALPQNTSLSNGLIDELRNNLATAINSSSNFRSQFSPNLDHASHPLMDCNSYPYKDLCQVCPRFSDLLQVNASIHGLAPAFNIQRSLKPRSATSGELHLYLEECYEQCKALEKDRKRTESILVKHYPGKKVTSTNNTSIPRLTANPSRVDRLLVDQLREQARVATLLGKMERFRSSPLHANISTTIDRYLEAIHNVQARRKDEIVNTSNRHKRGKPRHHDDRDVFILASSIKDMAIATRKARTALWCALQMTQPKMSPAQSPGDMEHALQTIGKAQG